MNKALILSALLNIIIFSSCSNETKYPGYSKTGSGVYYKLHSFGSSEKQVNSGDYVSADFSYKTIEDSTFFEGRRTVKVSQTEHEGSIDECIMMLSKGDKATFIIPAYPFFNKTLETSLPDFLEEDDSMKITVDLMDVQREKEFMNEKEAFLKWIEDFGDYEKEMLQHFLEEKKLDRTPTKSGLYHVTLEKGNGPGVEKGDTLLVHYEGKFLNGKFFDSTIQRKRPFEFVYGHEMQVIKGMEEVIGRMREGEKALAIMKSDVAFGKTGSSTGIVPPYTSVVFEVTLVDVKKEG
ncbi:MAG: FKBP-type peptidyl-prolyl cis-trans isomerase [Bacteroidota bacterium]